MVEIGTDGSFECTSLAVTPSESEVVRIATACAIFLWTGLEIEEKSCPAAAERSLLPAP